MKFLIKIIFIGFLPLLVIDRARRIDLLFDTPSKNTYLAAIIDKVNLLKTTPSPRLILMSGSSMAFGIDSDKLENTLGLPVVNAALHFSLGSHYMMEELKSFTKKGDIVLISLEYIVSSQGKYEEQLISQDFYPPAQNWIHYHSFLDQVSAYSSHRLSDCRLMIGEAYYHSRDKTVSIDDTTSIFYRSCFSKKGDLLCHLNNPPTSINYPILLSDDNFTNQIQDLNDFASFAQENHIKVYFTFPCLAEKGFEENMKIINKMALQIKKDLKIPILGTPENALMDDALFYDNAFHPNAKGREIFTKRLLKLFEMTDDFPNQKTEE